MNELTTENFKQILKEELDKGFEQQAVLIDTAFQEQEDHFDKLIADLKNDMDQRFDKVEERLGVVETKLDRALYTELVHLESRVKRLEEKAGIKSGK